VGWRCAICSGILLASNADAIIFDEDFTPRLIPIHSGKCSHEAISFLERDKNAAPRTDESSGQDELTTDDNVGPTPGRLELRQMESLLRPRNLGDCFSATPASEVSELNILV